MLLSLTQLDSIKKCTFSLCARPFPEHLWKSLQMSSNTGVGMYDSLFDNDDGEGTLPGSSVCFNLGVKRVVSTENRRCIVTSWCQSSFSSCCSLCLPPEVSEDRGDDTNLHGLSDSATYLSKPNVCNDSNALIPLFIASVDEMTCTPTVTASFCSKQYPMPGRGEDFFRVPIKSISIPRSCFDPSPLSSNCPDYSSPSSLPDDALRLIVTFLDVASICSLRECNRKLCDLVSKDCKGWTDRCTSLWSRKANVCSAARDLLEKSSKVGKEGPSSSTCTAMEAFKLSVVDAANRKEISIEEFCFDASSDKAGAIWSFRFKERAGRDWTSWDPWWNQQEARKLVFLRDGTMKQVYPRGARGASKSRNGTLLFDVFSERTIREDDTEVPAPLIEMKWRFVTRPLDLPDRPEGAYVRITVGGRDVPTYVVHRSPNGNWGFILESCWGMYASFAMAPRLLPLPVIGRTRPGSRWVNGEDNVIESGEDGELERERMRHVRRRIDLFLEESAMTQDGYSQWREALLYNIGAVTLPEGNGSETDVINLRLAEHHMTR